MTIPMANPLIRKDVSPNSKVTPPCFSGQQKFSCFTISSKAKLKFPPEATANTCTCAQCNRALDFPRALRHHAPIPPRKTRDAHPECHLPNPATLSRVCLAEWISRRGRRDDFKMITMRSTYIALFGVLLLVAGSFTVWVQAAQQPAAQSQPDSSTAAKAKKKKKTDSASATKKAGAADKSATAGSSTTPKKTSSKKSAAPATAQSAATPADDATPKKTRSKKSTASDVPATTTPAAAAPAATPAASTAPVTSPAATPAAAASAPAAKKASAQQAPPANSSGTVWVNSDSGVYHKPGTRWYGKAKQGKYMTEAGAQKAGYRAAAKE
jgi:hypothetical protein